MFDHISLTYFVKKRHPCSKRAVHRLIVQVCFLAINCMHINNCLKRKKSIVCFSFQFKLIYLSPHIELKNGINFTLSGHNHNYIIYVLERKLCQYYHYWHCQKHERNKSKIAHDGHGANIQGRSVNLKQSIVLRLKIKRKLYYYQLK